MLIEKDEEEESGLLFDSTTMVMFVVTNPTSSTASHLLHCSQSDTPLHSHAQLILLCPLHT